MFAFVQRLGFLLVPTIQKTKRGQRCTNKYEHNKREKQQDKLDLAEGTTGNNRRVFIFQKSAHSPNIEKSRFYFGLQIQAFIEPYK